MRAAAGRVRRRAGLAGRVIADTLAGRRLATARFPAIAVPGERAAAGWSTELAAYSAPIINPLYQAHVYDNKMNNLGLLRDRMTGLVIAPGELFSFWRLVGPPVAARGFREASAFIGGRLATAMGGGICQLSGVVYNAALLAGCRIVERHAHSIDAYGERRYIPLGRDATVAFGYKDLRFTNPHPGPLCLEIAIAPDRARVALWARAAHVGPVRVEVQQGAPIHGGEVTEEDRSLPAGERVVAADGFTGCRTVTWRTVEAPGRPAVREQVSADEYLATPRRVRVGPPRA